MSTDKPNIGVTARNDKHAEPYADAIGRSGGNPVRLLGDDSTSIADELDSVGALVICGSSESVKDIYTSAELALLNRALDDNMPVLALGDGFHVLNIAFGGKEPVETPTHAAESDDEDSKSTLHHIFITPGCKTAVVVGSGGFVRVNSRHSHGLREAQKGDGLLASAYSLEDGVIEALESPKHHLVIGVQFSPERFNELPPHFLRLFQSLADRAKEYRNDAEKWQ